MSSKEEVVVASAAFRATPGLGMVDQDAPHQTCRDRKEMRAVSPRHMHIDQLYKRFMDHGRGLQGMTSTLVAHVATSALSHSS